MNSAEFFEKTGRYFFTRKRLWILIFLCFAPFFLTVFFLTPRLLSLRGTQKLFEETSLRGRMAFEKRKEKENFLNRFANSKPYFIDERLESIPLLKKNLEDLQMMKNHPACKNRSAIDQRIAFLQGSENRLSFAEENIRSSKRVKETEERLIRPVEVNAEDIAQLLSLIENVSVDSFHPDIRSPQLLIQDLILTQKDRGTYQLQLNLLKREFTQTNEKNN